MAVDHPMAVGTFARSSFAVLLLTAVGSSCTADADKADTGERDRSNVPASPFSEDPGSEPSASSSADVEVQRVAGRLRLVDASDDVWVFAHAGQQYPAAAGYRTRPVDVTTVTARHTKRWVTIDVRLADLKPVANQELDVYLSFPRLGHVEASAYSFPKRRPAFATVGYVSGPNFGECPFIHAEYHFADDRVHMTIPRPRCLGTPAWVRIDSLSTRLYYGSGEGRDWTDVVVGPSHTSMQRSPRINVK